MIFKWPRFEQCNPSQRKDERERKGEKANRLDQVEVKHKSHISQMPKKGISLGLQPELQL